MHFETRPRSFWDSLWRRHFAMSAPIHPGYSGYSIEGSLDDRDIRTLYAACHLLRFSGAIELIDAQSRARVEFVGGDPIDIHGGDTQKIALFRSGHFRMVQLIPDLDGSLTDSQELQGYLRMTKPSKLWAWAGEHRLSCEMILERAPDRAVVVFHEGHAESAEVNGQPELAALARVSSWGEGAFAVRLRPLLGHGLPSLTRGAEREEDKPLPEPRQFDLSRSISVPASADPAPAAVPPQRLLWVVVVAATTLVLASGIFVLYATGLWPFGPRARPLVSPATKVGPPPTAAVPPPATPAAPPTSSALPGAAGAASPSEAAPALTSAQRQQRLVAKGRQLLAEGHEHTAADLFKKALHAAPDDVQLAKFVQQASGQLGRAELVLEGTNPVVINGHRFTPPRHVKIVAGPHAVDLGKGPQELVLQRGEKRRLSAPNTPNTPSTPSTPNTP